MGTNKMLNKNIKSFVIITDEGENSDQMNEEKKTEYLMFES